MGKGRRNRERSLQDRLANPAAKNLKTKKKSGMPSWLTSVIAVLVVVVILLPLIISAIQESGFFPRHRILIESNSGEFDINQQMATFIAWESLYESGLTYYQYMQYGIIQDTSGITSFYTADQYAMDMAYAGTHNSLRDSVDGVVDLLKQYVAVCDLAHKEGVTLTDEEKTQIDEVVNWLNQMRANTAFTSLDKFLGYYVGTGIKEKDVRAATELVILYNKYVQQKQLALDEKITLEDLNKYREENPEAFYKIDYLTYALKDKDLSEQLKACKTPLEFNNLVVKIFFDENYKTLYNQNTLLVEVTDVLKNTLGDKTDANDGSGTALSDAWATLGVTATTEYSKDNEKLDEALKDWLFSTKRKQFESDVVVAENGIYLLSFYSKEAGKDTALVREKFYEFKDGASHEGDDKFMETLLKVLTANNNGTDEKVEYTYKTASEKANELRDALKATGADVEKLLKDAAATEVKAVTTDTIEVPASIRKNVFSTESAVKAGDTLLVVDNNNYYVVYVRALTKPEASTADAESDAPKATADIAYVKTSTDLFCTLLDTLDEELNENFRSEPYTASFLKETTEGSYQEFLFELKEGDGWVSARKNGDTIVIETTKEDATTKEKTTTYTVYMAVENTDYNKDGEMLYIQKDRIVNGGYLQFGKELMAMEAMEQLKDKTGDELIKAFAALTSDDSTNTVKASTSYERANVDIVNKDLSEWLFDEARKDGDVKIIEKKNSKGDVDGYYLAYYVDHEIKWEKNARSSLLSAQLKEWIEELAAPYTVNEKVLNKIGKPTPVETEAETAA